MLGTDPVNRLCSRYKEFMFTSSPISDGIDPENELCLKDRDVKRFIFPTAEEIDPTKLLNANDISVILTRRNILSGILPVRRL